MSRRLLTLLTTLLLTVALTGCGQDPVPAEPSIGKVTRSETLTASGLALVTEGRGVARLVGTLLNEADRPDRLVGVDVDTEIGDYSVVLGEAPLVLRPDEPYRLAREGEVTVVSPRLRRGFRVELTLAFRHAAPVQVTVPVESRTGPYADVPVPDLGR